MQFCEPLMADVSHYFISLMHGMIAVHKNNQLKLNGVKMMFGYEDMDVP